MRLSEYVLRSRDERTEHTSEWWRKECVVGHSDHSVRRKQLREALLNQLGVEDDVEDWNLAGVNVCHVCHCDSPRGYCAEPTHAYLGTAQDNANDRANNPREGDQFPDPLWKQHLRLTEPCSFGGSTVTRLSQASFLGLDEGELTPLCNNRLCTNRAHWTFVPEGLRRAALREAAAERVKYLQGLRPDASTAELAKLANVSASLVRRLLRENGLRPATAADGKSYSASHREARLRKLNGALSACERDLENHLGLLRQLLSVVEAELQSEQQ